LLGGGERAVSYAGGSVGIEGFDYSGECPKGGKDSTGMDRRVVRDVIENT
jgi:hypothetical protein